MAQHGASALVRVDLSPAYPQELPLIRLQVYRWSLFPQSPCPSQAQARLTRLYMCTYIRHGVDTATHLMCCQSRTSSSVQNPESSVHRRPFVLEVRDYPWSPRWSSSEMARRIYAVLMEKLPEWRSGAVQAELGM